MQAQNIREYELVRAEMTSVKDCMTNYIGFVLGGSGVALFGVISLGTFTTNLLGLSYVSLFISILISLVLMILFYKFNSHNRFAGYCKLLNHERFDEGQILDDVEYVSWELCLERLRQADIDKDLIFKIIDIQGFRVNELNVQDLQWIIRQFGGNNPRVDRGKCWKGMGKLFMAFWGRARTNSWAFPPFVASIFFVLCIGYLILGLYSVYRYIVQSGVHGQESWILLAISSAIVIGQAILWIKFCGRLHVLLEGSTTVSGFFWRFLPIRAAFLNKYNIIPKYEFAQERLLELRDRATLMEETGTKTVV